MEVQALQNIVGAWAERNFPAELRIGRMRCTLGVCEEAGELAHAILKRDQGIRGTEAQHVAAAQDAIGDIIVYLMDLCAREGWDLYQIINETVLSVTKRDWISNPANGV